MRYSEICEMSPHDPFVHAIEKIHNALLNKGIDITFDEVYHAIIPGPMTAEVEHTEEVMQNVLGLSIHAHDWEHKLQNLGLTQQEIIALSSDDYEDYDVHQYDLE